ncbi:Uncharacterised protein [Salmonella enterica subsp. enterica serovar Typhi]|nr:Uncharacterised protein [Salmonella enterica subsp. enterica serovar Typhi]CGQ05693.1 Uncharacterised protein [Salmonella enterica subsp. enterica serovar Typhi]CGQ14551.1 Uncharacterised protein [Salmonella enterica subsp. enterica serovar Typhi]CGQ23494.1 Uncharacterised protein [Salmonella enterica subsp. enterica serovar Typhi]CGX13421.1 Uncharacterised protein [Salmonella enterica subsp. enterica serovar Typhi]
MMRRGCTLLKDGRLRAYIWLGGVLRRKYVTSKADACSWFEALETLHTQGRLHGRGQLKLS